VSAYGRVHVGLIENTAQELARRHRICAGRPEPLSSLERVVEMSGWLEFAQQRLSKPEASVAKAAEWFLDNSYLVQRAIRQIQEDLPAAFYTQLPVLEGPNGPGLPRIYAVACGMIDVANLQVTPALIVRFLNAYQEVTPLDLSELWALPVLLRLCSLEELTAALARLDSGLEAPLARSALAPPTVVGSLLDDTECVARLTRLLRTLSEISWPDLISKASIVERVLAEDPAGVYRRMDVETRNRYRAVIEELARHTSWEEVEIAERVVSHSRCSESESGVSVDPERTHVGYWLLDSGREEFERSIGFRPSFPDRVSRLITRHTAVVYLGSLSLVSAAILIPPAGYLHAVDATIFGWMGALLLASLPASMLAVTVVNWVITSFRPPCVLPKIDFTNGIDPEFTTAVVVPALLGSEDEIDHVLDQIECRFLCNSDRRLRFVLLTDCVDAPAETMPEDAELVVRTIDGIQRLNACHGANEDDGPFYLFHRKRRYNPRERVWMGWERKRGKLEQFNQFLIGEPVPDLALFEGRVDGLSDVRFVITLDADTQLPRDSAARLVGTLAHPLNRARFSQVDRKIERGYSIIQPRIATAPESGRPSLFNRLFCGDTAIDIYSRAVSDAYQDLLGIGIYVGKGIYDVEAFRSSLEGRIPENALLSHDLFEGLHARVALASDIVLYEDYPPHYLAYAQRLHRWVRGDWQLHPWLASRVPSETGGRLENSLSTIGRWMIADNLRRSMIAPALLVLLIAGWLWLPGNAIFWTLLALLAPAGHLVTDFASGLAHERRRIPIADAITRVARGLEESAGRCLLMLAFLAFESVLNLDAALRTLVRTHVTGSGLLQWTTSAHTASQLTTDDSRRRYWRDMATAPLLSSLLCAVIAIWRPTSLPAAAPLLLAWLFSPEIAYWIGRRPDRNQEPLTRNEIAFLRHLARRTWLFFETFVGPDDHWLPPDNYQEEPREDVAHRTSPTNIGMMLLSSLAAWDLGYIGLRGFSSRLSNSFDTIGALERYRGHLLNWYDTQSLTPLQPRYVSTVDSGNLAGALLAFSQGCIEMRSAPIIAPARWDGLVDILGILEETGLSLSSGEDHPLGRLLGNWVADMTAITLQARSRPELWDSILDRDRISGLGDLLGEAIDASDSSTGRSTLRALRIWIDRIAQHLEEIRQDLELLLPWHSVQFAGLPKLDCAGSRQYLTEAVRELKSRLPTDSSLTDVPRCCDQASGILDTVRESIARFDIADEDRNVIESWIGNFQQAIATAASNGANLDAELNGLTRAAESLVESMDFRLLYDEVDHLFFIGFNLSSNRPDPHHYDLLASEARLASFIAIATHQVPAEHWFALGRPMTRQAGSDVLLSWGGTLFEYLMPPLLMGSQEGTLLSESQYAAVAAQIDYGERRGIPWGISESGFAAVSVDQHYQYRAFGVPGLGLRRGLAEDLVVAPYATGLALPLYPHAATRNFERLNDLSMIGDYGFYEAVDFTPERLTSSVHHSIVRSYMAHHQGMILSALDNFLCDAPLPRRFHTDRRVESADLLLHERVPLGSPVETPLDAKVEVEAPIQLPEAPPLHAWQPVRAGAFPEVQVLGNGRLSSLITDSGAGGLSWLGAAVTRWAPDSVLDADGYWIYVRDEENGAVWSIGRQPIGHSGENSDVIYQSNSVEFHRRDHGITLSTEITVAFADDVEIRVITIRNDTPRTRRLVFTSYAEVVLAPAVEDEQHPAFSKLFVESEFLPAFDALALRRRSRSPDQKFPHLLHRAVYDTSAATFLGVEGDRSHFIGRSGSVRRPAMIGGRLSGTVGAGLDPIMSLQVGVEMAPHATERIAFVTLVSGSRESLLENAERFDTMAALDWVREEAANEARWQAHRLAISPDRLPIFQRLLSLLIYPNQAHRCTPHQIAENHLDQSRLWSFGISGDLPILLLHLFAAQDSKLLRELVRANQFFRSRGFEFDLVVLSISASSYASDDLEELRRILRELDTNELLGRDGGVHLLRADQIAEEERNLLEVCARVILDAGGHGLEDALVGCNSTPAYPPAFVPTHPERDGDPAPALERPSDLLFDNSFGGFTPDGREYLIHLEAGAETPAPWCNVLANEEFGCLVSESGMAYSWALNSAENRLTPWSNDPVTDRPGEALYLRDEETAQIWTPTPQPAGDGSPYQVTHGAGYSEWRHHSHGLEQRLRVFVPVDAPVKIARLRLRNTSGRIRRITSTYYAEWVLGKSRRTSQPFIATEYDPDQHALLARCSWGADFAERTAFLVSDRTPHGVTADRSEFIGREGGLESPASLGRFGLSDRVEASSDPCAALQIHLDIAPDEEVDVLFALGQGGDRSHACELARDWRDAERVDRAWLEVREHWDHLLDAIRVDTPEPAFDLMINRWLLYQSLSSRILARSGFYQSSGAFGFRDQLQDRLAFIHVDPEGVRDHIVACAARQFREGDVLHWWHPPGNRGVRTRCSDDLLWLPFATAEYVRATGDRSILDVEIPFLNAPLLGEKERDRYGQFETSREKRSLFEHCERALERGVTRGIHGLPLIGSGDWNDGMDRVGERGIGESVWLAWFAISAMSGFVELCEVRTDKRRATSWRQRAQSLKQSAQREGWDGEWYLRAFDDEGLPWGSKDSEECRIDSISQSWAVLSGAAPSDRADLALRAADRELVRDEPKLVCLLWPPFDTTRRDPGYIKGYPPGMRENGGQYTHAATWLAWALAKRGNGDRAAEIFRYINPISHAATREEAVRYAVEPYVIAADIYSAPSHMGRGGWTWYTGAAAWAWRLGVEAILGIKRVGDELEIDPRIPREWEECRVAMRFPSGTLEIRIENPDGIGSGVREIFVDDQRMTERTVRIPVDGHRHEVIVRLGESSEAEP
jgi:cyclic beta-1,2-glucan synthetase